MRGGIFWFVHNIGAFCFPLAACACQSVCGESVCARYCVISVFPFSGSYLGTTCVAIADTPQLSYRMDSHVLCSDVLMCGCRDRERAWYVHREKTSERGAGKAERRVSFNAGFDATPSLAANFLGSTSVGILVAHFLFCSFSPKSKTVFICSSVSFPCYPFARLVLCTLQVGLRERPALSALVSEGPYPPGIFFL
ncbi:hypothetical protein B0J12DRAFT_384663 [Macrophomina phaseolina]|uniref:Secreted protein n=1 Tax=Macrophomina phaseolina TaxID=35725 RepID=A0ABQ8FT57_9PEZI|nr:hypothetical protein B0J12DRAFT_384663 [Macrophomina phaseolina]